MQNLKLIPAAALLTTLVGCANWQYVPPGAEVVTSKPVQQPAPQPVRPVQQQPTPEQQQQLLLLQQMTALLEEQQQEQLEAKLKRRELQFSSEASNFSKAAAIYCEGSKVKHWDSNIEKIWGKCEDGTNFETDFY